MKNFIIVLALSLASHLTISQTLWGLSYGGVGYDSPKGITIDSENGLISTGTFYPSIDVDPSEDSYTLYSGEAASTFVQKLNGQGELIWGLSINGDSSVEPKSIANDSDNNIYIIGFFEGTVDFNPGPGTAYKTSNGYSDIYLLKLNSQGVYQWVNTYGSDLADTPGDISINDEDEIIISGSFQSTIDLDPSTGTEEYTSQGDFDLFIQHLDTDGEYIWNKIIRSDEKVLSRKIQKWDNGDVLVFGQIDGQTDFDPSIEEYLVSTSGNYTGFLLSLSDLGDFNWVNSYSSSSILRSNDISITADLKIHQVFVMLGGSADIDPGPDEDIFTPSGQATIIQQIDNEGELVWSHTLEASSGGLTNGLTVDCDSDGTVLISGQFSGEVDFDPGDESYYIDSETIEVFLLNLTDDGSFVLAHHMQSAGFTAPKQALFSDNDDLFLLGHFTDSIDIQLGEEEEFIYSNGTIDVFLIKVAYALEITDQSLTQNLKVYPNPFSNGIYIKYERNNPTRLRVLNNIGSVIYEQTLTAMENYINLSFLPIGNYILEITDENFRATTRIAKLN